MILKEENILTLIEDGLSRFEQGEQADLLREIMCALVSVESGRNPWAVRYEAGYRWTIQNPKGPSTCSEGTEEMLQKMSWGLCQIMGATARALNFKGWLTELLDPKVNLLWGLTYLHRLGEKFLWDRTDMISSWNQGSPRREEDGQYRNQPYVDKVLAVIEMTDRG